MNRQRADHKDDLLVQSGRVCDRQPALAQRRVREDGTSLPWTVRLLRIGTIFVRANPAVSCQKCEVVREVEFRISAAALSGSLVRWGFILDELTMRSGTEQALRKRLHKTFCTLLILKGIMWPQNCSNTSRSNFVAGWAQA